MRPPHRRTRLDEYIDVQGSLEDDGRPRALAAIELVARAKLEKMKFCNGMSVIAASSVCRKSTWTFARGGY